MDRSAPEVSEPATAAQSRAQRPFAVAAPVLLAALWLGAGGGFLLAATLTTTQAIGAPLGVWWLALAQAHGHLQLYGWAGLFVIGVALHFVPRLRGIPLAGAEVTPWALGLLVTSLLLRAVSQPLLAAGAWHAVGLWQALFIGSGILEVLGAGGFLSMLFVTNLRRGPPTLRDRPALWSILPFVATAGVSLALATLLNLANVLGDARLLGLIPSGPDEANTMLGLFGVLVPMAIGMSTRALPMYAGLEAFPRRVLWPAALVYAAGLALATLGSLSGWPTATPLGRIGGVGLFLMGAALVGFISLFGWLMRSRGRLPQKVRALAPEPERVARSYTTRVAHERATYGPYVALIGSAYAWAFLGGLLLLIDGVTLAFGAAPLVSFDVARHSFAVGFIALLIAGVAVRMIPGFSGGRIRSARLVVGLLWLGNGAALLRVGSLLLAPLLSAFGSVGGAVESALFGLSGPVGLTYAICLLVTMTPAIAPER